ncbi:hypothetical protein D9M69_421490 [compost metagenome]
MNAETFSSAYEREPARIERNLDPEQERLLERPNAWSKAFGYILHDYLSTGVSPVTEADFKKAATDYEHWFNSDFGTLYVEAQTEAEKSNTREAYSLINHLNFHTINRVMLPLWSDTLFNEKGIQPSHVKEAQTVLSHFGLHYMKDRETRIKNETYFDPSFSDYRATSSGILNEYDTAITLLNISLKNPDVAILPAPIQFESQHPSSLNSDFIAIRQSSRQARGIQAKARRTDVSYRDYDPDYVTLIDGIDDLGNGRAVRLNPRHSRQSVVAWPGLISAEYLRSVRLDNLKNLNKKAVLQSKFQAHSLSRSTKPYLATATARVSERVLRDLERQVAPLIDTIQLK